MDGGGGGGGVSAGASLSFPRLSSISFLSLEALTLSTRLLVVCRWPASDPVRPRVQPPLARRRCRFPATSG